MGNRTELAVKKRMLGCSAQQWHLVEPNHTNPNAEIGETEEIVSRVHIHFSPYLLVLKTNFSSRYGKCMHLAVW